MYRRRSSQIASSRRPLLQALFLIGQTYIVTLLGLFVGIFSARGLSVADRGALALLLLIVQLSSRFGTIGFEQIILRDGTEQRIANFYYGAIFGAIVTSPIVLFGSIVAGHYQGLIVMLIFSAACVAILRVNTAVFIHSEKLKYLATLNICQTLTQLVLYAAVYKYHSVNLFLFGWVLNVLAFAILSSIVIYRGKIAEFRVKTNISDIFLLWREGLRYSGVALPEMAISFCLELPVIRIALGGVQSGLYSISNTLTGIYFQLFVAISAIAAKRKSMTFRYYVYGALLLVCCSLIIVSKSLITLLFGEAYSEAAKYAVIMLPVTFVLGVSRIESVISVRPVGSKPQLILFLLFVILVFSSTFAPHQLVVYFIAASYTLLALSTLAIQAHRNRRLDSTAVI